MCKSALCLKRLCPADQGPIGPNRPKCYLELLPVLALSGPTTAPFQGKGPFLGVVSVGQKSPQRVWEAVSGVYIKARPQNHLSRSQGAVEIIQEESRINTTINIEYRLQVYE